MARTSLNIVVTCGPAFEPIDGARRITNFSTGRLGVTLANELTRAGHRVCCLKGEGATYGGSVLCRRSQSFSTNDDLAEQLRALSQSETIEAVFHAAALCDFRVDQVLDEQDRPVTSAKFSTREGRLKIVLKPAAKVLPLLRTWFPAARIVGWKYELNGGRDEALARVWRQLAEAQNDGCVLNGAAYGAGFAFCTPPRQIEECPDALSLGQALIRWLD